MSGHALVSRGAGLVAVVRIVLPWLLAVVPVVIYAVVHLGRVLQNPNAHDWMAYSRAADALLAGHSPYASWQLSGPYGLGDLDKPLAFAYPPSSLVVVAPFLATFELWTAFNILVFLGGILAVVAVAGISPLAVAMAGWISVYPVFLWDGINGGGVSPALAGLLGLVYAGVPLAGIGGAVKLYPFAWAALPMRSGIRTALPGVVLGAGIPAAISLAIAGIGPWADWLVVMGNTGPACGRDALSLVCAGVPQLALWLAAGVLLVISFRVPRHWALFTLGLVPIVAAPQVWAHYFLLLVPGVVAVLLSFRRDRGGRSAGRTPEVVRRAAPPAPQWPGSGGPGVPGG